MRLIKRLLLLAAAAAVVTYLGLGAALYAKQRNILFRPSSERVAPADAGLTAAKEVVVSPQGAQKVLAWFVPPADAAQPVFLYLHGNAANLARRAGRFQYLTRDGAGLLAVSWRGYGGSEGSPSEAAFREDAAHALAYLKAAGIAPDRIVLFGESLGSGVAVMLAARTTVRALVLDSPYESIVSIAAARYWWLPVDWLMRDPFRADLAAPEVKSPTLAVACRNDWQTPYDGAVRLMRRLGSANRLITVDGRCHVAGVNAAGPDIMAFARRSPQAGLR
jgi:uncharacterized protein